MKKVLSFVLALAMVVVATVPAFATGTGVVDDTIQPDSSIEFLVTRGGLKQGINGSVPVTGAESGTANYQNGEGEFEPAAGDLAANSVYEFRLPKGQVQDGTPSHFVVRTDAYGRVDSVKGIEYEDDDRTVANEVEVDKVGDFWFEFKLNNPKAEGAYTIYARHANGDFKETATPVRVYPVKVADGEYVYADGEAINQVDYDRTHLATYTVPAGDNDDEIDSKLVFSANQLRNAQNFVSGPNLPIVAIVAPGEDGDYGTDDDVVVFTNFSKDKQAVLTFPGDANDLTQNLKVVVRGGNPLVAVPGATVEIQRNSTELFGKESFGTAVATGTTNANGEVEFTNIQVADLLKYLSDTAIVDGNDYEDAFAEIKLPFRAVVTNADGYRVPKGVTLTAGNITDNTVVITLTADGASDLVGRLKGSDRYATSAAIADELYDGIELGSRALDFVNEVGAAASADDAIFGKKNIILANGHDFADALTANGLTAYYDAPVL